MISQQASANTTKTCLGAIVVCDVKMDQKWILVILVFYQKIPSGAAEDITVKEGQEVEISCRPELGSMVIWFRLLGESDMEFIGSYANNGIEKTAMKAFSSIFRRSASNPYSLTLKSFNKMRDSGAYICAALVKGTELRFGKITQLVGEKAAAVQPITTTTTKQSLCTTAAPCVCKDNHKKEETSPSMFCTPIILGPLAGGCGLLLLLLIITIVFCNKIRTRRCPHHYKKKLRTAAGGKQMMTGRHV
ncbi:T-cell surface glycoprotein CD8 alpha chain [Chelmon rostratus]|uniref:T-cell surface glycoprotein CD8 alpha chain n=1 Tax=Chelmon rostratus TaxID=109905 RepID=UPI001BE6BF4D|nr:T-cell surface glycoprotein CD8 alpha chain [Chelmon rostratus]